MRRKEREGTDDGILASDCVWFPLVLISWCYFQITPFACHYHVCVCKCVWQSRTSGNAWISHSLNRQSVSYTLTLFQLPLPHRGEIQLVRVQERIHLNPLNDVFPYLQPLCSCSRVLHILPVSPHSTNECRTDLIHFAGDISLPPFNCLL